MRYIRNISLAILLFVLLNSFMPILLYMVRTYMVFVSSIIGRSVCPLPNPVAGSFGIYCDFVTIVTGLLTLVIGFIGVGGYVSFKKFEKKEEKLLKQLEGETKQAAKCRSESEVYLNIQELNMSENLQFSSSAVKILNDAIKKDDEYYMLFVLRGEQYLSRGELCGLENAEKDFRSAIKLNRNSSRAYIGLGKAIFKREKLKYGKQERKSLENIKFDTTASRIRFYVSSNVVSRNDFQESIGQLKMAIDLGAEVGAFILLGDVYNFIGKKKEALAEYERAYKKNEMYVGCAFFYVLLYMQLKDEQGLTQLDFTKILKILRRVAVEDLYNSKAAYALLWYLFEKYPQFAVGKDAKGEAEKAKSMTDLWVINDLFELRGD